MIQFFRRIRQRLLSENKFSKYLLYAIGEIFLVVIGILIALQINNWNEWRKDRKVEVKLLKEIQENLTAGIEDLQYTVDIDHSIMICQKIIINHLTNKLPYNDSLATNFYHLPNAVHLETPSSGYYSLKSRGLEVIQNDSLRSQIINTYDIDLPWLQSLYETDIQQRRAEIYNSELYEHFYVERNEQSLMLSKRIPFNYDELLEDNRFKSMVISLYDNRQFFVSQKNETLNIMKKLIVNIQKEINRIRSSS